MGCAAVAITGWTLTLLFTPVVGAIYRIDVVATKSRQKSTASGLGVATTGRWGHNPLLYATAHNMPWGGGSRSWRPHQKVLATKLQDA